jgi:hypothetical protein
MYICLPWQCSVKKNTNDIRKKITFLFSQTISIYSVLIQLLLLGEEHHFQLTTVYLNKISTVSLFYELRSLKETVDCPEPVHWIRANQITQIQIKSEKIEDLDCISQFGKRQ